MKPISVTTLLMLDATTAVAGRQSVRSALMRHLHLWWNQMPQPSVTPWQDVGDQLAQGGTVEVSSIQKLDQQFPEGKSDGRETTTKS